MNQMSSNKRGILSVIGSSVAIFWPGAFIFGFPGVMGPHWERMFHVGRGPIGNTLFFMLVPLGVFMFFVGHWQEKLGTRSMITIGTIICVFSIIQLTFASNIFMLYLLYFILY